MEYRKGFSLYGVVFLFGIFSFIVSFYFIQVRVKEFVFYKELARQRVVEGPEITICGGPQDMSCQEGYSCRITKRGEDVFGKCVKKG